MWVTGYCLRKRVPNAASKGGLDKNLRLCVQGGKPVFLLGGVVEWIRLHTKRFQAINGGEMVQFYETCLLVPGPLDNDLDLGYRFPHSIPGLWVQARTRQRNRPQF